MYSAALSSRDNPHSSIHIHLVRSLSLSLSLSSSSLPPLPLPLFLSLQFRYSLSFVLVWRFCLFLTPPFCCCWIRIGPRLPPPSIPSPPRDPPPAHTKQHQQQSPANSIAFPTLFILDRLVSSRCFPCNDLYDLVPVICYSRVFSCFPVEVEREKTLASID